MTQRLRKRRDYDARLTLLEREIATLREQMRRMQGDFRGLSSFTLPQPPKPKRGRRPTISSWVLKDRDELVEMLEAYWPELSLYCDNRDEVQLRSMLEVISNLQDKEKANAAKHVLTHFDKLLKFLESGRYHGEPRHIANALAGVNQVSWWRSLKFCGARPSEKMRDIRTIKDYLIRKHPDVYERLARANGDVLRIAVELRRVRSRDQIVVAMKQTAVFASQVWRAGIPNFSQFGVSEKNDDRPVSRCWEIDSCSEIGTKKGN